MSRRGVLTAAVLGLAGLAASAIVEAPVLVWNATASAPPGLWFWASQRAEVGDWAFVRPGPDAARLLSERGLLPPGALLLKRVTAEEAQLVCRMGPWVLVDGQPVALARDADGRGRPLPRWAGCHRLAEREVFLLSPHPDSFDGRYLGVTSVRDIVGRAAPFRAP